MDALWDGKRRFFGAAHWNEPLRWNRAAEKAGFRRRVFCASMADVFDNHDGLEKSRARLWDLIRQTPYLDWMLLTKRIGNAKTMLPLDLLPAPNVWLGATVVNQAEADRDIPKLLATPAEVRFLSIEPMLGPLDLRNLQYDSGNRLPEPMRVNSEPCSLDALRGISTWPTCHYQSPTIKRGAEFINGDIYQSQGDSRHIDWVVAGGESGSHARPSHPDWFRSLRDQCTAARVAFHFKQHGEWAEVDAGPSIRQVDADSVEATVTFNPRTDCLVAPDGRVFAHDELPEETPARLMRRLGKLVAGRAIDGREWDEFPRAAT